MNVILIGYMGSGKTTLGKKLSSRLGLKFIDTDSIIEKQQGSSIQEIFNTKGESYFRELEKKLIFELKKEQNILISTGGGLPCFNDLMDELNEFGITIYLKRPAKELANRVMRSKKKRPLLIDKSEDELLIFIENTLQQREPIYEQAHIVADREIQNIVSLELYIKVYMKQHLLK